MVKKGGLAFDAVGAGFSGACPVQGMSEEAAGSPGLWTIPFGMAHLALVRRIGRPSDQPKQRCAAKMRTILPISLNPMKP